MSLLTAIPVMASDIDLSSMSTEDLVALKDSINEEIANRGGDNIIGEGLIQSVQTLKLVISK